MAEELSLEQRIRRIEDRIEIEQLMYRYVQYLALMEVDKVISLFAHRDDVITEGNPGGFEMTKKFFTIWGQMANQKGIVAEHHAICPVIEIAKDGQTARGTWFSPGIMGMAPINVQTWNWGKYDCKFIKENGEWKIWQFKWHRTFEAEYEKGWLHSQKTSSWGQLSGNYPPADKEAYDPDKVNHLGPEPPEPY